MLYLNTRGRLPNAGMDARPSPQMSKPFAFLIYLFLWVLATFRPANQRDACTVRVEMMLFIITFWKTCSRCKKKAEIGLQCSPRNFASWTWRRYEIHTYICVFAETYFLPALGTVGCWEKKGLGIFLLTCQCPWRLFPCISAGALALKMNRNVCMWFWMQQVFSQEVNFRQRKYFMVQITQDSFTYSTLHIDMVVL